jgi:hypothetical protein
MFILIPVIISLLATLVIFLSPVWPVKNVSASEKQFNLKKTGVFLAATVILTSLISLLMWVFGTLNVWDCEVWNYKVVKIRHDEKWTEKERRTRQVACGTETYYTGSGKDRRKHTRTKYKTEVYYVTETYGPYWKLTDEYGETHNTDEPTYNYWKNVWANEQRIGEHKGSAAGFFDTPITGGIFESKWTNDFAKICPYADIHRYKNKVRYSHSVLKLQEPTPELLAKYPRPADQGNTSPVISYGSPKIKISDDDVMLLRRVNASLGVQKRIHAMLIVFWDEPRTVVDDVLMAWRNPNKNELCTFISLGADRTVNWVEVHSWMDNTALHGTIEKGLAGEKFYMEKYADLLLKNCPRMWTKKDFRDFDYLRVDVSSGWKIASLVLCLIAVVGAFVVVEKTMSDDFRISDGFMQYKSRRTRNEW